MNRVCDVLNIEKPIIQGPMAWISTAPLVAAVSNAGGLGVLGVGFAPHDFVISQIEETKKLTNKPFGINTVIIPENLDGITQIIKETQPPVIYADTLANLDYDLCKKYFDIWHEVGCKIVVKASFISDAITAEKAGCDAIVIKGWEGGGHITFEATTVLVPQAADQLSCPVIASGGIADGRAMAAMMALGAEGIEMGTIFMAAKETAVHSSVKDAIVEAGDMSTVVTGYCTDEPCRQIKNKLSDQMIEIENNNSKTEAAKQFRGLAESSLKKAMMEGDMENGAVMAGQVVSLIHEIKSVEDIMNDVMDEAKNTLQKMSQFEL